jgi:mono/diheme cytochrome c family protein
MRFRGAAIIMAGAVATGTATAAIRAAQEATKTTWDGVYSETQAQKGETLYNDTCAKCHGPDGAGGDAPDLVGGGFASDWETSTLGQLFDRTRIDMPQDHPGSLSRDEAAALVAYLLRLNGFPAGQSDLPTAGEYLSLIKYVAVKPAATR